MHLNWKHPASKLILSSGASAGAPYPMSPTASCISDKLPETFTLVALLLQADIVFRLSSLVPLALLIWASMPS